MSRTIVLLGASSDQLFLYRTAREMGLAILAVDQNPASPGFALADEHALVSTRDVDAISGALDERRARGWRFAGVTTMGSDIPDVVARVAAHLGTPGVSLESARLATDKLTMKERLRERDVPIPWFAAVASAAEVRAHLRERGLLVLKPVDRSGSRGVFLLDQRSDVATLFDEARAFSFSGRVMVEEFLQGPQISTESVLCAGRAVTPGFADRNYELLERFRPQIMENGGWVPSLCSPAERRAVQAVVEHASRALGIESGVTKGDVVLTADGPKVIEIAARLSGGDFCAGLVPLGSGVNYVRAAIQLALGETPDLDALAPRFQRAVANRYFFPEPGRLVSVEGLEDVQGEEWLAKLELWYRPGEIVPPGKSHAHRFGVFVVVGPDRATVQERVERVYRSVRIRTEPCATAA
jgi:biotin carboxylase